MKSLFYPVSNDDLYNSDDKIARLASSVASLANKVRTLDGVVPADHNKIAMKVLDTCGEELALLQQSTVKPRI